MSKNTNKQQQQQQQQQKNTRANFNRKTDSLKVH